MIVLGLTGSIGMGKSTAAAALARMGVPLHDADAVVHRLLASDRELIDAVRRAFPGVYRGGCIDRQRLAKKVFGEPAALSRLEAMVHPRVRRAERRFLERQARRRARIVVLDIPLLFETDAQARCDAVIVVTAPAWLQAQRVLRRPGFTADRLQSILERQVPDREKRRRADFVVQTGLGKGFSLRALQRAVRKSLGRKPRCWPPPGPSRLTGSAPRLAR